MKHGSLCQLRRHNSRALLNYIRLELTTKNRPAITLSRPNFQAMASQQSLIRNGKWLLPSFYSLYFWGGEAYKGTEVNFRLNFRSKNFLILCLIQRDIRVMCSSFTIFLNETCEKYKKKNIYTFSVLFHIVVNRGYIFRINLYTREERKNERWSERNGGANIYARLFKFDDSKGGAVNFKKQTSR